MSRLQYFALFILGIVISSMTIPKLWDYFQPSPDSAATPTTALSQDVAIHTISAHYISALRRLNTALLPVFYSDRLYREVLGHSRYCKIALFKNVPIGAITARFEDVQMADYDLRYLAPHDPASPYPLTTREYHVYIMTLGVLAPYRRLGVGSALVQNIMDEAEAANREEEANPSLRPIAASDSTDEPAVQVERKVITALTLHVQFNNTVGMDFYKSHGFEMVQYIEHYYTRIEPRGAYLLVKKVAFTP